MDYRGTKGDSRGPGGTTEDRPGGRSRLGQESDQEREIEKSPMVHFLAPNVSNGTQKGKEITELSIRSTDSI